MDINYPDGSVLAVWYDAYLVLIGFFVALVLAVLVLARGSWRGTGLLINTIIVLAVLAGLPLTMLRVGIDIAISNHDIVGYISILGAIVALALSAPYLARQFLGDRVALAGDVTDVEPIAPGQGVTMQGEGATIAGAGAGAPTQAPMAFLHFKTGPRAGQSIPLGGGTISIGRGADNEVVMDDPTVSRHHARIIFEGGHYFVEDAGSMGGTLIEGMAATKTLLSSGASIQLGETEVIFMQAETPTAAALASTASGTGSASDRRPAETVVMGPSKGIMSWLAVTDGPEKGKTYQLKVGENRIGRGSDNDLVFQDSSVSRSHAMIQVQDDSFVLVDLGSGSGTKVGETTLSGKPLKAGSAISVGQTRLSLVQTESQAPVELATMTGETVIIEPGEASGGVLVAQSGPDAGKTFALVSGDNLIGREPGSSVLLTDDSASRRHALIRKEQDRLVIFDLGSRSGTSVDGESISGYRLSPGETISLGRTQITLIQLVGKGQ